MQPQRQQDLHLGRHMDEYARTQKIARRNAVFVVMIAIGLACWIAYMGLKKPEAPFVNKWLVADSVLVVFLLWFSWVRRRLWAAMLLLVVAGLFAWLVMRDGAASHLEGGISQYMYNQSQQLLDKVSPTVEPVE